MFLEQKPKYTIEPNISVVDPNEEFGQSTPTINPVNPKDNQPSFGKALLQGNLFYNVGRRLSQLSEEDSKVDPNWVPFDEWKKSGLPDKYLEDVMNTRNEDQFNNLSFRIQEDAEREEVINSAGLKGQAADFVFSVATDPLTYASFGLGALGKAGVSAKVAYSATAAAGGATYTALDAFAKPEDASLAKSAAIIGGAAIVGGVLGSATDTFSRLKTKGIINKNFQQMSSDALNSAAQLPEKYKFSSSASQDLSAAVNSGYINPETYTQVGGGPVARAMSKFMASKFLNLGAFSPKQVFMNSDLEVVRQFGARTQGTNIRSVGNEAGVAQTTNTMVEQTDLVRNVMQKDIIDTFGGLSKFFGRKYSELDAEIAFRASHSGTRDFSNLTPVQKALVEGNDKIYSKAREILVSEKVPDFNAREVYGTPVIFNADRAAKNVNKLAETILDDYRVLQTNAPSRIAALEKELVAAKKSLNASKSGKAISKVSTRVTDLEQQIEYFERIRVSSLEELETDALVTANLKATGMPDNVQFDFGSKGGLPSKSRFFNERQIDPLKYIDFLEIDPIVLAQKYSDSVSPHIAFNRAFPEYGGKVSALLEDFELKATKEISDLGNESNIAKLLEQKEQASRYLKRTFEDEFGLTSAKSVEALGSTASQTISSINNIMYVTQMVGQTIASLTEPLNIMIHKSVGEGLGLLNTITQTLVSKDMRNITKQAAADFAVGMEYAVNSVLKDKTGFNIIDKELGGAISRNSHEASRLMSAANLSNHFDQITRRAMIVQMAGYNKNQLSRFSKLNKDEIADLAYLGIDKDNYKLIKDQLDEYGTYEKGIFNSNMEKWDNAAVADTWRIANRRDLMRTSMMAQTGDVPHFFRTPAGRILMKYKTWSVTATSKLLIQGVQRGPKSLAGFASLAAAGVLIQTMLDISKGKNVSTDPDEILWGGLNRAGVLGIVPEMGASMLMNAAFGTQSGGGKLYEYSKPSDFLAGPLGAFANDVGSVLKAPFPEYDKESGGFKAGWNDKDGNLREGLINSMIDVLPIPIVRPWIKEYATKDEE